MADWSKPTITSNYITFVDEVKNRDIDALTLQKNPVVNPPLGAIKMSRAPMYFSEWNGSSYIAYALSIPGGGTGAGDATTARGNLGIGTLGTQNSNSVSITGGGIQGVSLFNCVHYGGFTITTVEPGHIALNVNGASSAWAMQVVSGQSGGANGLLLYGGLGGTNTLYIAGTGVYSALVGLTVGADMRTSIPIALVIPVGADKY